MCKLVKEPRPITKPCVNYDAVMKHCPPTLVATHTYANPVVAVLLGWLFAAEPLNARLVWASLAILGAIVLIRRGERKAAETPTAEASNFAWSDRH